ncbi:MAG: hypothetical protein HC916_13375 [Coleofasciculaceae cyanobacterium SM2_1_6]|nr:hypothetical protein [Coleofasciculaceae cyanobacterium SM2_1_6]
MIQFCRPFLGLICFLTAWWLIISGLVSLYRTSKNGIHQVRYLHSIPCSSCEFFTNDYRLKCTVHPDTANSGIAIHCSDFCPRR